MGNPTRKQFYVTAEDTFTDRVEPQKSFRDLYSGMQHGEYKVLNFYGIGGIGKTTLLKKLEGEISSPEKEDGKYVLYFNLEKENSKNKILLTMATKMKKKFPKFDFSVFLYAYMMCIEKNGEEAVQMRRDMQSTFLDNTKFEKAATVAGDLVPMSGTITLGVKGIAKFIKKIKDKNKRNKAEDSAAYQSIDNSTGSELHYRLHEYFVYDAFKNFERLDKPFVIMLDGYEALVNKLAKGDNARREDLWIRDENGLVQGIPNILWVIAGREKLEWPESVLPAEQKHLIGNLSDNDSLDFFHISGVQDDVLCKHLYDLTAGTPVYMDLCIKKYKQILEEKGTDYHPAIEEFGKNTEELAVRFPKGMDIGEQKIVQLLSCMPDIWNENTVHNVARSVSYEPYLDKFSLLLELSLIEKYEDSYYKMHETFRIVVENNIKESEKIKLYSAVTAFLLEQLKQSDFHSPHIEYYIKSIFGLLQRGITDCKLSSLETEENFPMILAGIKEWAKMGDYEQCISYVDFLSDIARDKALGHKAEIACATRKTYLLHKLKQREEAKALGEWAYKEAQSSLPTKDEVRLDAEYAFVCACYGIGEYQLAKEMALPLYERRKNISGENHKDTLSVLGGISAIYYALGDYNKAIEIETRVYQQRKQLLGENAVETLGSMGNLATYYSKIGNYDKTAELDQQVLAARKQILGAEHPDTIAAQKNLEWSNNYLTKGCTDGEREMPEPCCQRIEPVISFGCSHTPNGNTTENTEENTEKPTQEISISDKTALHLRDTSSNKVYDISSKTTIGRDSAADIVLEYRSVSKQHCQIEQNDGEWYVTDLGSTNKTIVNGDTIIPGTPTKLEHGDQVKIGEIVFSVEF